MGSCYSVGSNTRYSRLDHGPASVSTRPRYFSDHVVGKATENSSHDMTLEEAGLDPIYVAWIEEQSSKMKKIKTGSCYSVGSNTRYSSLGHGSAFVPTRPKYFSYDVLKNATRNFSRDMMLVEAGPDSIYVGWIDEQSRVATKPGTGIAIAVKKLFLSFPYGTYKEWKAEIYYLGQLNHQNIVKLIGYCHLTVRCRIHVYEFMPKGSLQSLLFRRGVDYEPLSWNRRLNIAVGVAKGLAYLDTTKANIRDHVLTSSMILTDSNYNAKLSNLVVDKTYSGYLAPEYKVKSY
ncbi:putative serine/threonine-protein kinase PBL9 [Bidens hawaiensis]|uniref:putative serine/threonine-protein kinase PBL9 n=1 Tax=Bidens hawaiensis TaxID=980011 RepID=UPI0040495ECD